MKNPLLFQFIRKAIEWTVIIIEEFHSCLPHIKLFRTYFHRIRMDIVEIGINARNWVDSAQDRNYWRALVNAAL